MNLITELPIAEEETTMELVEAIAKDKGYLSKSEKKLEIEDPTLKNAFFRYHSLINKNSGAYLGAGFVIRDILLASGPIPITNGSTFNSLIGETLLGISPERKKELESRARNIFMDMKEENPFLGKYFDWMVFENGKLQGEEMEVLYGGTAMYDYLRTQAELNRILLN